MDNSFYLSNLRELNTFVIYDSNCAFLTVCSIGLTTTAKGLSKNV